jgi:hypothetical protein
MEQEFQEVLIRIKSDLARERQEATAPLEITRVSPSGTEADLCLVGTNFELFRVPVDLIAPAKD